MRTPIMASAMTNRVDCNGVRNRFTAPEKVNSSVFTSEKVPTQAISATGIWMESRIRRAMREGCRHFTRPTQAWTRKAAPMAIRRTSGSATTSHQASVQKARSRRKPGSDCSNRVGP